jgi:hypothetical protein
MKVQNDGDATGQCYWRGRCDLKNSEHQFRLGIVIGIVFLTIACGVCWLWATGPERKVPQFVLEVTLLTVLIAVASHTHISAVRAYLWHNRAEYRIESSGLVAQSPSGECRRPTAEELEHLRVEITGGHCDVLWKPHRRTSKGYSLGEGFMSVRYSAELRQAIALACPRASYVVWKKNGWFKIDHSKAGHSPSPPKT